MSSSKEVRDLIKEIESLGFDVIKKAGGHWKVYAGSAYIATLPCSPGDQHSLINKRSQLRRLGVPVAGRHGIK
jgi:predicted RNA binding protein YcfA (HicA-like mRNA interferase family)